MNFRNHVDRILDFSVDKFGEDVVFYPKSGGVFNVRAIFDNEYQTLDPDTEQTLSVNQPALGVNLNDIKFKLSQGDKVKIRGVMFKIADKREDGQGGATLLLHKATVNERLEDTKAPN
jgi:hypothetical protein